jgi:tetratricopeptide (TPR) repeat protein
MPDDQRALSDTLNCMGNLLLAEGDHAKAAEHYRQALELGETLAARFPDGAGYANHLAWFLASCEDTHFRDPARAVVLAQKAVGHAPKEHWFQFTLGVAQYRHGQWQAAVASLEKANQLRQGAYEGIWLFQAMAHWKLGEKEAARTCYDRAVQLMKGREYQPHVASCARAEADALLGIREQKQ